MKKSRKDKPNNEEKPKVHPELEGFEMKINSLGEITSTYTIDELNAFLNKKVVDKKLKDRSEPETGQAENQEE
jgi:hypothetical protein